MRILHLIDTTGPGGAETVFIQLATGLDPSRFTSIPVVLGDGWVAAQLLAAGASPQYLKTHSAFDLGFLARLIRMIRKARVDVIHAHLMTTSVYGAIASRITGIPVVCTFHGSPDFRGAAFKRALKLKIIERWSSRLCFVSESLRHQLSVPEGPDDLRNAVIYNGVDTSAFAPSAERPLRAELSISHDTRLLMAIGNIRPAKDYDTLLRAVALLADGPKDIALAICGDDSNALAAELRKLSADLRVDHLVHFLGHRHDIPTILPSADLFVLSSYSEGFSLATVQAMLSGVPVIATRSGGPEEIILHGETGSLVPTQDPSALATSIAKAMSDPAATRDMAHRARLDAQKRFSLTRMLEDYQSLYGQLHCFRGS